MSRHIPEAVGASFILIVLGVSLAIAAERSANKQQSNDDILAQINDRKISVQEFAGLISEVTPSLQPFVKAQKARFLQGLVEEELLFQDGKRKGLDKSSDVAKQVEQASRKILVQRLINAEIKDRIQISDQEIEGYYTKNRRLYEIKERARIYQIVVKRKDQAQEIWNRLKKGENFSSLALVYSVDSSRAKGGSLGFVERESMGKTFDEIAFSLKPGEISPITETPMGYQILKLVDHQPARVRPFLEVKESIRKYLRFSREKKFLKEYIANLRKNSKVHVQEELLKKIH